MKKKLSGVEAYRKRRHRGGLKPWIWIAGGISLLTLSVNLQNVYGSELSPATPSPGGSLAGGQEPVKSLSGKVRVIRKMGGGETEVFFTDLNESYFIPKGSSHNIMMKAFQMGEKLGAPVSFKATEMTHRIVEISGAGGSESKPAPLASKPAGEVDSKTEAPPADTATSSEVKK